MQSMVGHWILMGCPVFCGVALTLAPLETLLLEFCLMDYVELAAEFISERRIISQK